PRLQGHQPQDGALRPVQELPAPREAVRVAALLSLCALASCAHPQPVITIDQVLDTLPRQTVGARWDRGRARGQVTLVMFLTSWCFPCIADLVVMEKLQRDFGPQ